LPVLVQMRRALAVSAHESQSGSSSGAGRKPTLPAHRQVELARAPVRRALDALELPNETFAILGGNGRVAR